MGLAQAIQAGIEICRFKLDWFEQLDDFVAMLQNGSPSRANKKKSNMTSDSIKKDDATTVKELREIVRQFVAERDWKQFHSPKNLSMALAIEAGELMEHFQWISPEKSRNLDNAAKLEAAEELADVLCYALAIANEMDIDLASTLQAKMVKNRAKYPAEEFRGRYGVADTRP